MKNRSEYSSLILFLLFMIIISLAYIASAGIFKDQILKRSDYIKSDSTDSVIAEGHKFENKTAMQVFMMDRGFNKLYPHYKDVSSMIVILLAVMSFAGIGVLLNHIFDEDSGILLINKLLSGVVFSMTIWFIGERIFNFNQSGSGHNSIFIISFIAGIFTSKFINALRSAFPRSIRKR